MRLPSYDAIIRPILHLPDRAAQRDARRSRRIGPGKRQPDAFRAPRARNAEPGMNATPLEARGNSSSASIDGGKNQGRTAAGHESR
jgi:hypothetical protein